jgi:3-methylcrotonyl-CoA carboxylase beta subunit
MAVLLSNIDSKSPDFVRNADAMRRAVDDLNDKLAKAVRGGSDEARARHGKRGKLLVRDRIAMLLDPGSPFLELSALAAHDMYGGDVASAGIVTGIGQVNRCDCVIVANDATIKGGTYYPMTVKKHLRAHAFIWSTPAVRSCRCRTRSSPTAITSAAFSTTRRRCRPPESRRSRR